MILLVVHERKPSWRNLNVEENLLGWVPKKFEGWMISGRAGSSYWDPVDLSALLYVFYVATEWLLGALVLKDTGERQKSHFSQHPYRIYTEKQLLAVPGSLPPSREITIEWRWDAILVSHMWPEVRQGIVVWLTVCRKPPGMEADLLLKGKRQMLDEREKRYSCPLLGQPEGLEPEFSHPSFIWDLALSTSGQGKSWLA